MRLQKTGMDKRKVENPIIKLNALLGPRVTYYILLEQNDRETIIVYLLILPKLTHSFCINYFSH